MKTDIDKGLKPNEVLQLTLSAEDLKKYKIGHRRTIFRYVTRYLEETNRPYRVATFLRDGEVYVQVRYTPASRETA